MKNVELSELVALAYEAGVDPAKWPAFLERVGSAVSARTVTLQVHDTRRAQGSLVIAHGVEREHAEAYANYYASLNPWTERGADLMQPGRVLTGEMALSKSELKRTEFYADFLRPQDIAHSIAAVLERNDDVAAFLAFQLAERTGPPEPADLALIEQLMPHLRRALALHKLLGGQRLRDEALVQTADRLHWGVLFVDNQGRVTFANAVARKLDAKSVARVIAVAQDGGGVVPRARRMPLTVTVSPLTTRDEPLLARPALAVFVIDPDHDVAPSVTVLRDGYGLTPAEIKLAQALAAGDSLGEIAEQTQVSIWTLRSHLKKIFQKTGTRRQSELVRLLAALRAIA